MRFTGFMLIFVMFLTACAQEEKVKVGVLVPMSGAFAPFGEQIIQGIEDANQGRVSFIVEDTVCDNVKTSTAYKRLTEVDDVQFILGPGCGSPQQIVATELASKDQLAIIPSAATHDLWEMSNKKLFQIQYSLEQESAFMADKITRDGYQTAVVISYDNAFSQTLASAFLEHFEGDVLENVKLRGDTPDDTQLALTKIQALNPDAVFVSDLSFFIYNGLVKLRGQENDVPVYGTYVVEMPFVRDLVEGVIFSYPDGIDDEKGGTYSLAYQAADILINAIEQCNGEYACVKNGLETSDKFDDEGISTRNIGLFKIENGAVIKLKD
ncbi:hypothetical protein COV18_02645 [Candidatus Woesearchaeota archaeon CG10_big_fil_rev_8_21_14_0_10_37_12]|nr:MAG: hypothetical protein COV18_02645 [Candidatus Woesearchaeota archaeon CG10_big_fil_rev_8_21_14_0_10_37_12]